MWLLIFVDFFVRFPDDTFVFACVADFHAFLFLTLIFVAIFVIASAPNNFDFVYWFTNFFPFIAVPWV